MIPGSYNLPVIENSTNVLSFVISGITTASGYSAAIDIRSSDADDGVLLLGLTSSGGGLAVTSDGSNLTIVMTITEAQADTLIPLVKLSGAYWSLKVTAPGSTTLQYLLGSVTAIRTPTA